MVRQFRPVVVVRPVAVYPGTYRALREPVLLSPARIQQTKLAAHLAKVKTNIFVDILGSGIF